MDRVLFDLTHTPYSRRIMTNMYTFSDLCEMHLYPCAYSVTYNVTAEPGCDKPVLNMVLMQRSQDILAANNWNVCQYAILLMMVARHCDMVAGELLHVIVDAHIYDRHVDIVRELIERPQFRRPGSPLTPKSPISTISRPTTSSSRDTSTAPRSRTSLSRCRWLR